MIVRRAIAFGVFVGFGLLTTLALATPPFDFGFGAHGGPIRTLGAPRAAPEVSLDPAACRTCHADHYAEWAGSMHGRSFVDPVFRAELAHTADGTVCRTCHAPLGAPSAEASAAHDVGVACGACHVRDGALLSTRTSRRSPHRTRVVAELDDASFCGACHDFDFPDLRGARAIPYDPDTRQQLTVTEWSQSRHAREGRSCVDCHMPAVTRAGGRAGTSHALRSLEDAAFVRDALDVSASIVATEQGESLRLELRTKGAGHAVPTGDIFRELRVRAIADGVTSTRTLRRNFAEQHTARGWVLADAYDDRVMPDVPKTLVLPLPRGATEVRYVIEILRLDLRDARLRGLPEADVVVPVAEGVIRAR